MSHELNILYFAYGSNMVRKQMAHRCPGATVFGNAVLRAHRFHINARTYATIIPDPACEVHGVLWRLSAQHESSLDHYESVAKGHYYKETVDVNLPRGDSISVMTYYATNKEPGRPRHPYIEGILESAIYFKFPGTYLELLRKWV